MHSNHTIFLQEDLETDLHCSTSCEKNYISDLQAEFNRWIEVSNPCHLQTTVLFIIRQGLRLKTQLERHEVIQLL